MSRATLTGGVIALLLLALLTVAVRSGHPLAFDRPLSVWLHGQATPPDVTGADILNVTGTLAVVVPATLITAAVFAARQRPRHALTVLGGMTATLAAQLALNAAVHRPRPTLYPHLVAAPGLSYPSGHTALAAALGTLAAVLAWRTRWRWPTVILALGYAVAMGTARVLLGVHNPSDVLAGWLLGSSMGLLAAWMGERVRHRRRATRPHR
ncbi:phosphatase PAP2 family protein [Deinococcus sp. KSM4-11]|uniref:phosphatase PAP2 family protein n=1 Tax=Deinococcus sp. KSM4-11 TaxID=2568654 RepID=UPI0010A3BB2E|nr:phosphatase PAP2 family protein [Deinococcus sp. KSM4-11]THF84934.1 phosphatase PAP2 family protein [Deinococcus sp. KSM4-11]